MSALITFRGRTCLLLATLLISLLYSAASYAELRICNGTPSTLNVAFARDLQSEAHAFGWYTLKPGTCEIPIGADARTTDLYYYAYARGPSVTTWTDSWTAWWEGEVPVCTRRENFSLRDEQAKQCSDGLKRPFRNIDDVHSKTWTLNLTGSGMTISSLKQAKVAGIQAALIASGYDAGAIDGIWGPATKSAWRQMVDKEKVGQEAKSLSAKRDIAIRVARFETGSSSNGPLVAPPLSSSEFTCELERWSNGAPFYFGSAVSCAFSGKLGRASHYARQAVQTWPAYNSEDAYSHTLNQQESAHWLMAKLRGRTYQPSKWIQELHVRSTQSSLNDLGFDVPETGQMDPRTMQALREFLGKRGITHAVTPGPLVANAVLHSYKFPTLTEKQERATEATQEYSEAPSLDHDTYESTEPETENTASVILKSLAQGLIAYQAAKEGRAVSDPYGESSGATGSSGAMESSGTIGSSGSGQCKPLPPRCQRTTNKAMRLLERIPTMSGITTATETQYCNVVVSIEVNRFCADRYRAQGRTQCATLSAQQANEYRRAAARYEEIIGAASASGIRRKCSWE